MEYSWCDFRGDVYNWWINEWYLCKGVSRISILFCDSLGLGNEGIDWGLNECLVFGGVVFLYLGFVYFKYLFLWSCLYM